MEGGVSRFLQHLTGQYAQYLHGRLNRRGRLWQSRFYSCVLDNHHFLTAVAYVDLNAVRARMVDRAEEYEWSSAAAYGGLKGAPDWLDLAALHSRRKGGSVSANRSRAARWRRCAGRRRRSVLSGGRVLWRSSSPNSRSACGRYRRVGRRRNWRKAKSLRRRSRAMRGSRLRSVGGSDGPPLP